MNRKRTWPWWPCNKDCTGNGKHGLPKVFDDTTGQLALNHLTKQRPKRENKKSRTEKNESQREHSQVLLQWLVRKVNITKTLIRSTLPRYHDSSQKKSTRKKQSSTKPRHERTKTKQNNYRVMSLCRLFVRGMATDESLPPLCTRHGYLSNAW